MELVSNGFGFESTSSFTSNDSKFIDCDVMRLKAKGWGGRFLQMCCWPQEAPPQLLGFALGPGSGLH